MLNLYLKIPLEIETNKFILYIGSNFFRLGLTSLLTMQIVVKVTILELFKIEIS